MLSYASAVIAIATPLSNQIARALLRKACRMPGNITSLDVTVGNDGMWEIQILFRFLSFLLWVCVPFLLCNLQKPLQMCRGHLGWWVAEFLQVPSFQSRKGY